MGLPGSSPMSATVATKGLRGGSPPAPERSRSDSSAPRRGKPALVLLIDPRPLMRECLSRLLQASALDLRVLPVSDAAEVPENGALPGRAGLIVLNIGGAQVTESPVVEAIGRLRRVLPDTPIVILSDREETRHVAEAIRRGVSGYVPTTLPCSAVIEALRFVRAGGTFVPASAIVHPGEREQQPEDDGRAAAVAGATDLGGFTSRELEVLALLRQGKSNKIIAHELDMQESTLKVHVRHIKDKLRVTNRTEAALLAQQLFRNSVKAYSSKDLSLQIWAPDPQRSRH
jgi:DNA-binding NarL/FixJ family response regulator